MTGNPYHDETGRFSSREEMNSAVSRLSTQLAGARDFNDYFEKREQRDSLAGELKRALGKLKRKPSPDVRRESETLPELRLPIAPSRLTSGVFILGSGQVALSSAGELTVDSRAVLASLLNSAEEEVPQDYIAFAEANGLLDSKNWSTTEDALSNDVIAMITSDELGEKLSVRAPAHLGVHREAPTFDDW